MSYIIQRRVKKAIYVYEGRSYRNKQGKPRSRQRYLGRLGDDGVLITRKRRLPAKIREVKTVTKRFILEPVSAQPQARRTLTENPPQHITAGENNFSPVLELHAGIMRPRNLSCFRINHDSVHISHVGLKR